LNFAAKKSNTFEKSKSAPIIHRKSLLKDDMCTYASTADIV
jgi:hypothetical protein